MVFALHSKVVQNLAAVVKFVRSIIKTLNCCGLQDAYVACSTATAATTFLLPCRELSWQ